jgi:hypothetical protein
MPIIVQAIDPGRSATPLPMDVAPISPGLLVQLVDQLLRWRARADAQATYCRSPKGLRGVNTAVGQD